MKSATQQRFGAGATNLRSSRSGARSTAVSGLVVMTFFPRTAPAIFRSVSAEPMPSFWATALSAADSFG
ncbi:hypothetical protein ABZ153_27905 [Streptomyces sp. NPDC006290]|uniref:hypothetical protein n=1 Tax=Streptomyces sp. NPDC006290 TaxID=3156745 RepID=UPI0033A78E1B